MQTTISHDSDLLVLDALFSLQQLQQDEITEILAKGDSDTKTWLIERLAQIKQESDRILALLP